MATTFPGVLPDCILPRLGRTKSWNTPHLRDGNQRPLRERAGGRRLGQLGFAELVLAAVDVALVDDEVAGLRAASRVAVLVGMQNTFCEVTRLCAGLGLICHDGLFLGIARVFFGFYLRDVRYPRWFLQWGQTPNRRMSPVTPGLR